MKNLEYLYVSAWFLPSTNRTQFILNNCTCKMCFTTKQFFQLSIFLSIKFENVHKYISETFLDLPLLDVSDNMDLDHTTAVATETW